MQKSTLTDKKEIEFDGCVSFLDIVASFLWFIVHEVVNMYETNLKQTKPLFTTR